MNELQNVIKYYQRLADTLPKDLENRELLYQKYQEYIEKIKKDRCKDDD